MKTNLEYIRAFLGEKEDSNPLFSDAELQDLMKGHVIHSLDESLARRLSRAGVSYRIVDDCGLMRITLRELKNLAPPTREFYAGIGNWLDDSGKVFVNEFEHLLQPTESIDYLQGAVRFTTELPPDAKIEVEVYLLDIKGLLVKILEILKASSARLALRADLAGVSVDLSRITKSLEEEIEALTGSYELEISAWEDYPH